VTENAEDVSEVRLSAVYGPRGESILRSLAGEWFLVPIRTTPADFRAIFSVNEVGAVIWGELDGSRPLDAILEKIVERFDAPPAEVAADLVTFIEQLEGAGLVERRGP
jgi:hypothetical protein